MLSHEITSVAGSHKRRKRVGRGHGSGHGKTCGRGHNGSGSRTGSFTRPTYEGGQMPLFRRLPKRGFSNARFARKYEIINICQLERFGDGQTVGVQQMASAGLVNSFNSRVKILGDGALTKRLEVLAHRFSRTAEQKIVGCGGAAKIVA
jgi:large subunit ribosomal protein L15